MLKERKYGDLCMSILSRFLLKKRINIRKEDIDKHKSDINYNKLTLMYKNQEVAKLELHKFNKFEVTEIKDKKLFPIGIINKDNTNDLYSISGNLTIWMEYRTVPNSRPNIQECLRKLNIKDTTMLSCKAFGLSFCDSYWLKPDGINISWEDINLYDNGFSNDIGDMLVDITSKDNDIDNIDYISPDSTTRGEDIKRWICDDDNQAYLIKTNLEYEQPAYNEVIANLICKKLGAKCAEYNIVGKKNVVISDNNGNNTRKTSVFVSSKNFCEKDKMFVPADYLRIITEKNNVRDLIDIIRNENPDVYNDFLKMLVLDFIIDNKDRHSENFGFEFDENGKMNFATIFDNGNSLYYDDGLNEFYYVHKCKFGAFYNNRTMLDEYISNARQMQFFDISNFTNIKQEIIDILNDSDLCYDRINAIANFIEHQIEEVQKFKEQLIEKDISIRYEEEIR